MLSGITHQDLCRYLGMLEVRFCNSFPDRQILGVWLPQNLRDTDLNIDLQDQLYSDILKTL